MDDLSDAMPLRAMPTHARPLAGLTVLLVEDSRFASEAVRLLCLRSGARLRRADTLAAAARHLAAYCPDVVIVDLGLPDGSGTDLIVHLSRSEARPLALLALSGGDPHDCAAEARTAGADGFLPKPVASLAGFQQAVLAHLPADRRPRGLAALPTETVQPDRLALAEDLDHAARLLEDDPAFAAEFVVRLARADDDADLAALAQRAIVGGDRHRVRLRDALSERRRLVGSI